MHARPAALLTIAVLAGCGPQDEAPPVAPSCSGDPDVVVRALTGAPGTVTLNEGGTRISACVRGATSDGELQSVGVTLSRAAEDLEARALDGDEEAALQLGYLVGAAREGARTTSGISAELVHRLERSAGITDVTPAVAAALERGLAAGRERG